MDIVTKHFDIFDDVVILDLIIGNTLQLWTYHKHKLKKVEVWKLPA